ncbi:hypothetical protein GCM10022254_06530 [Actinomadura meridiana]|uniref:Uncharacterized protein n=1 Tax=Actinomadura meridiana TaxID=559626 RepID=A0ABP8BSX2_9ACTN
MNGKQNARKRTRRRRRLTLLLERPPKAIKIICAIPAFVFMLEAGMASLALLNNGRETITGGTAIVRTCTRDLATGWLMYRCNLEGVDDTPIGSTLPRAGQVKTFTRLRGSIDFEIRETGRSKAGRGYVTVKAGTPRHSVLVQAVAVVSVSFASFFAVFIPLLRLPRLAARAIRPHSTSQPDP